MLCMTLLSWAGFPGGSVGKNLPEMQEMGVQSLGQDDPLENLVRTTSISTINVTMTSMKNCWSSCQIFPVCHVPFWNLCSHAEEWQRWLRHSSALKLLRAYEGKDAMGTGKTGEQCGWWLVKVLNFILDIGLLPMDLDLDLDWNLYHRVYWFPSLLTQTGTTTIGSPGSPGWQI